MIDRVHLKQLKKQSIFSHPNCFLFSCFPTLLWFQLREYCSPSQSHSCPRHHLQSVSWLPCSLRHSLDSLFCPLVLFLQPQILLLFIVSFIPPFIQYFHLSFIRSLHCSFVTFFIYVYLFIHSVFPSLIHSNTLPLDSFILSFIPSFIQSLINFRFMNREYFTKARNAPLQMKGLVEFATKELELGKLLFNL